MADRRREEIQQLIKPLLVKPGDTVGLPHDFDPGYSAPGLDKDDGDEVLRAGIELLAEYQTRLAAQNTYSVLLVLQAMDAAGKDGTIKHVMSGVNPQGVTVRSFKQPSPQELDHDFLWRYQRALPRRGDIGIFNRSHYEETLVVRVHPELLEHQQLPEAARGHDVWKRRFREVNDWEKYLVDNGIRVVKVFLNVSKEEQRQRFLARIEEPDKNWKFSAADVAEREHWDDYQQAFSEVLTHTSSEAAPWYVVPADKKWFARIATAAILIDTLMDIDPKFPELDDAQRQQLQDSRAALEAQAPKDEKH
ncbi:MAG TPA: polyphosphate kinase 2 family protein [Actinomycetes bacterium]